MLNALQLPHDPDPRLAEHARDLDVALRHVAGRLIANTEVTVDDQGRAARREDRRRPGPADHDRPTALGIANERIYVDHGLTGTNRARPGLREAMAACSAGDTLVVTKLDRLARSLPDARDIVAELTTREVKLSLGGSVHDPTDPVGRSLFNVLAMVAVRVRPDQDEDPGGA